MKYSTKFLFIILFIILLSFAVLQPKFSTWAFPQKRQAILNNFLTSVEKNKNIDARTFWEFREFYYPGYFTFEKDGLSKKQVDEALQKIGFSLYSDVYLHPFLIYHSNKLNSIEFLGTTNDLNRIIKNLKLDGKKIVMNTPMSLIYYDNNTIKIMFIKSTDEMVYSNGFYNFRNQEDVKFYEGKNWLSITSINLR